MISFEGTTRLNHIPSLLLTLSAKDEDSLADIAEGLNRLVKVKPILFQDCFQIIYEVTRQVCEDVESSDSLKCTLLEVGESFLPLERS